MLLLILIKVTVLFALALAALRIAKRSPAAMQHLNCVCALAGSLLIPLSFFIPSRAVSAFAIRLPAIAATAAGRTISHAVAWVPSRIVLAIWLVGSALFLIRLAVGHWRMSRIVHSATPATAHHVLMADVSVPVVCGLIRPRVLMPRVSAEWPDWQSAAAVRHEMAHICRHDLWTILIARVARAVWWFHPLAWMLASRLHDCQETACDDAVLVSGFEPATYAEALLAVAKTSTPTTLLHGCSMTSQTNLKSRITRLLDNNVARHTSRRNLIRTAAVFAAVLAAVGTIGLRSSRAQDNPDRVYKVGDGVIAPKILYSVEPQYTEEAKVSKINGTVILNAVVGTDGQVHDISIAQGVGSGLDSMAMQAIGKWRFQPGTLDGQPVAVRATFEVNFKLR